MIDKYVSANSRTSPAASASVFAGAAISPACTVPRCSAAAISLNFSSTYFTLSRGTWLASSHANKLSWLKSPSVPTPSVAPVKSFGFVIGEFLATKRFGLASRLEYRHPGAIITSGMPRAIATATCSGFDAPTSRSPPRMAATIAAPAVSVTTCGVMPLAAKIPVSVP